MVNIKLTGKKVDLTQTYDRLEQVFTMTPMDLTKEARKALTTCCELTEDTVIFISMKATDVRYEEDVLVTGCKGKVTTIMALIEKKFKVTK